MSLWYCTNCKKIIVNSIVCRCCDKETERVLSIDTSWQDYEDDIGRWHITISERKDPYKID